VDLMQLHNRVLHVTPEGDGVGQAEAVGAVAEGLQALVQAGLVRYTGFTGTGDTDAVHAAARSGGFNTVQAYFNALNPSAGYAGVSGGGHDFAGLIDVAADAGVGVIVIRPLAAGALSGTAERHAYAGSAGGAIVAGADFEQNVARSRDLAPLAAEAGLEGPVEMAVRFALSKPGVSTVLVGYSDQAQLESAIRWAERGPLPPDLVARLLDTARA
jgi:aryl-alcohol dehydrogenase-like predicted oxidoreductase